jgi:hypothetical protein
MLTVSFEAIFGVFSGLLSSFIFLEFSSGEDSLTLSGVLNGDLFYLVLIGAVN